MQTKQPYKFWAPPFAKNNDDNEGQLLRLYKILGFQLFIEVLPPQKCS